MKITEVKTLQEVSREYGIPFTTLQTRLNLKSFNLIEYVDYRKLGKRQPTIFTPEGIKKITKKNENKY